MRRLIRFIAITLALAGAISGFYVQRYSIDAAFKLINAEGGLEKIVSQTIAASRGLDMGTMTPGTHSKKLIDTDKVGEVLTTSAGSAVDKLKGELVPDSSK